MTFSAVQRARWYVEDGTNRWSAVYSQDAARVYRLALERGGIGARYHAIGEQAIAFREIAVVLGRQLGLPVESIGREHAGDHFGPFAMFAQADIPATSTATRKQLGWKPHGPSLLTDIDQPSYFR